MPALPAGKDFSRWDVPACKTLPMRGWTASPRGPADEVLGSGPRCLVPGRARPKARPQTISPAPVTPSGLADRALVRPEEATPPSGRSPGPGVSRSAGPGCAAHLGAAVRQRSGSPRALPGGTVRTSIDLAGHLPQGGYGASPLSFTLRNRRPGPPSAHPRRHARRVVLRPGLRPRRPNGAICVGFRLPDPPAGFRLCR